MYLKPALLLLIISVVSSLQAKSPNQFRNEYVLQESRYINVEPSTSEAQRNPLKAVIPYLTFNNNIKTVGQAIRSVLDGSGYKLTAHHPDKRVHKLFRLPLPQIQRRMELITLEQALETLAGNPWKLAVDPINRLISFELPDLFKQKQLAALNKKTVKAVKKPKQRTITSHDLKMLERKYLNSLASNKALVAKNRALYKKSVLRKQVSSKQAHKTVKVVTVARKPISELTWADLPKEWRVK